MFDDLPGFIWFDGQILPWKEARIHVMTHALHYASSVYEGMRSYKGKILKVQTHYERLHQSAIYLDFQVPYAIEELIAATNHLVIEGGYDQGYIRAIAWCGSKKMTVCHRDADVHVAIGVWERPLTYPERHYTHGIRMNIADWRRPDPRTAPVHSKAAGLYMTSAMSKATSERLGYNDTLMLDCQGNIAEASSSNIFLVIEGKLYTPTPDCFLNGITRRTCLEMTKGLGIESHETTLTLEDLGRAQEVFLTGTAIEILPVGRIEGHGSAWDFTPGKVTGLLREKLRDMIHSL